MSGLAADGRGRDTDREDGAQDSMARAITGTLADGHVGGWSAGSLGAHKSGGAAGSEAQRTAADLQADAAVSADDGVVYDRTRGRRRCEVLLCEGGGYRLRLSCDGEEMGGGSFPPDELGEAMEAGDDYLLQGDSEDEPAADEASAPEGLNARWTTDAAAIERARRTLPSPRYVLRQELRQRQRQLAEWQQRDFIEREFQRQARLVRRFAPVLKLMAESAEGQAARIHCTDPTNDEWKARWQAADPWGFELWKQACAVLAKVGQ